MSTNRNPRDEDPRTSKDLRDSPTSSRWSNDVQKDLEEPEVDSSRSAFQRWLRKDPNVVAVLLAGVLSLVVIGLVIGWRAGWFHQTPPPPDPAVQASASAPPASKTPAANGSASTSKPSSPPKSNPASGTPVKQPPPALPDDLSQWTPTDFVRARRDNDPKLLPAIVALGTRSRGDPSAVITLAVLLKPPLVASALIAASRESPPSAPIDAARLSETILTALGENGTEPACLLLRQTLSSADDSAVEMALKALATHPTDKTEAVLLDAVLEPESFRPADRSGNWPAKQLRVRALELLKPTASNLTRRRLAVALAERLAWVPAGDPVRDFLLSPDPLNCEAQIILHEKADVVRDIKAKLEQQLADLSAEAMAERLGLVSASPHESGGQGGGKPTMLAELLWSGPLPARIASQLSESRSLEKQPGLVALAATMPCDSIRAPLARFLRKNWADGPKTLEALGLFDRLVTDPALVVILKMGQRKDRRSNNGVRGRQPSPARPQTAAAARAARLAQAEQDWWDASAKLVDAWRKRFEEVSLARSKAAIEAGRMPVAAKPNLPPDFALSDNTRVAAAYDFHWPPIDSTTPSTVGDDVLEVHYLRLEESNRPSKAIKFYGRQAQARTNDARPSDRVLWLDGQRTDAKTGRRRSIDVFVTKPATGGEASKDEKEQEVDLVIEVLTIEIKDPLARD
ncbi:MAG: hypothetical protein LLF97_02690 [Planctomycetaceae bacterium]|nr:hypothetical protein [Planctomycetaceae bacterium]